MDNHKKEFEDSLKRKPRLGIELFFVMKVNIPPETISCDKLDLSTSCSASTPEGIIWNSVTYDR